MGFRVWGLGFGGLGVWGFGGLGFGVWGLGRAEPLGCVRGGWAGSFELLSGGGGAGLGCRLGE